VIGATVLALVFVPAAYVLLHPARRGAVVASPQRTEAASWAR
jgi:hypothetical protein